MLAMVNLRHSWRNSGKTPSQYEVSAAAVSLLPTWTHSLQPSPHTVPFRGSLLAERLVSAPAALRTRCADLLDLSDRPRLYPKLTRQGSSLDTPRFGSPRTDEIRPYSSSGRLAPGIEDECGMVELEQKNVSKEDLESGIDPFHY